MGCQSIQYMMRKHRRAIKMYVKYGLAGWMRAAAHNPASA